MAIDTSYGGTIIAGKSKFLRLSNLLLDLHLKKEGLCFRTVDTVFGRVLKMVVFPSRKKRTGLRISYPFPIKRECKTERR
jgi:hypothetical protein